MFIVIVIETLQLKCLWNFTYIDKIIKRKWLCLYSFFLELYDIINVGVYC